MNEPPRLKTPGPYQKERIQALGNAVVPQQAYPVFAAAYEFLDTIEKGVSCHG